VAPGPRAKRAGLEHSKRRHVDANRDEGFDVVFHAKGILSLRKVDLPAYVLTGLFVEVSTLDRAVFSGACASTTWYFY